MGTSDPELYAVVEELLTRTTEARSCHRCPDCGEEQDELWRLSSEAVRAFVQFDEPRLIEALAPLGGDLASVLGAAQYWATFVELALRDGMPDPDAAIRALPVVLRKGAVSAGMDAALGLMAAWVNDEPDEMMECAAAVLRCGERDLMDFMGFLLHMCDEQARTLRDRRKRPRPDLN